MGQNPNNSIKGITSNSDTDDPDSAYDELPVSDTSSETESNPGYRLLPEDIDTDTELSPLQDHLPTAMQNHHAYQYFRTKTHQGQSTTCFTQAYNTK